MSRHKASREPEAWGGLADPTSEASKTSKTSSWSSAAHGPSTKSRSTTKVGVVEARTSTEESLPRCVFLSCPSFDLSLLVVVDYSLDKSWWDDVGCCRWAFSWSCAHGRLVGKRNVVSFVEQDVGNIGWEMLRDPGEAVERRGVHVFVVESEPRRGRGGACIR